jgi:hypothetical protein
MSGEQRTHDIASEVSPDKTVVLLGAKPRDGKPLSDPFTPPNESDFALKEAAENFRTYLSILREWDEAEKRKATGEIDDTPEDAVESSRRV